MSELQGAIVASIRVIFHLRRTNKKEVEFTEHLVLPSERIAIKDSSDLSKLADDQKVRRDLIPRIQELRTKQLLDLKRSFQRHATLRKAAFEFEIE